MMLRPARSRRTGDSVVPMINVAFLMLVFFLMMAQIAPPDAFEVTPPTAEGGEASDVGEVLLVGKDGALAFRDLRGEEVFAAIAARADGEPLRIRAASDGQGTDFARVVSRLAASGVARADLLVLRP